MANKSTGGREFSEVFDRFFKEQTCEALRELVRKHKGENGRRNRLDFKSQIPEWPYLAKTILAMSNSGGGIIVLGVAQRKDNTFYVAGLSKLEDKADIKNRIQKFIPDELFALLDIANFDESGQKLQVIFIEDDPASIPFISMGESSRKIRKGAIYVRRLSSNEEATYVEIQQIIHRRVEQVAKTNELQAKTYELRLRRQLYGELIIKFRRVLGLYITYKEACDAPNPVYLASRDKLEIPGTISFPDEATAQAQYYQLASEEFTPLALAYLHLRWTVNFTNQFGQKSLTISGGKRALAELKTHIQTTACVINVTFEANVGVLQETDNGALLKDWRNLLRDLIELPGWKHLHIKEHLDCAEQD